MKFKILLFLIIVLAVGLRFYGITRIPALNADEAALGYNAYSLLKTGMDEHGNSWPMVFKSFGDYKPGVYVYLAIPFIKILGLNILAVRLPGLIFSVASVWLIYLVSNLMVNNFIENLNNKKTERLRILETVRNDWNKKLPLISALLLAISPWHIHFSRGAWETQVSITFLLLGIYAFLRGLNSSKWYLMWVLSFVISIYTYHSMRVVVPLMGLGLVVIYWNEAIGNIKNMKIIAWINTKKILFFSFVLGLVLLMPLGLSLFSDAGLSRAQGVSILADTGPIWRINEARGMHKNYNAPEIKFLYNQPLFYSLDFFENYLKHFSGKFLFIDGDEIQRNKVPGFGELYLVSIPFVLIGFIYLIANYQLLVSKLILYWLLIAPIPAALTFQSPHSLRSFGMVIPWTIITAIGIVFCINKLKGSKFLLIAFYILLVVLFSWDSGRYLFNYYKLMVPNYPYSSQYDFKELVPYLESVKNNYDRIYVTDRYDQPYILFLFFSQYSPEKFQNEVVLTPRDKFGFSTVRNFDKYHFEEIDDFDELKSNCGHCLIVGTDEEIPDSANIVKEIRLLDGKRVVFQIVES